MSVTYSTKHALPYLKLTLNRTQKICFIQISIQRSSVMAVTRFTIPVPLFFHFLLSHPFFHFLLCSFIFVVWLANESRKKEMPKLSAFHQGIKNLAILLPYETMRNQSSYQWKNNTKLCFAKGKVKCGVKSLLKKCHKYKSWKCEYNAHATKVYRDKPMPYMQLNDYYYYTTTTLCIGMASPPLLICEHFENIVCVNNLVQIF